MKLKDLLAQHYAEDHVGHYTFNPVRDAYLAGFEAARAALFRVACVQGEIGFTELEELGEEEV